MSKAMADIAEENFILCDRNCWCGGVSEAAGGSDVLLKAASNMCVMCFQTVQVSKSAL